MSPTPPPAHSTARLARLAPLVVAAIWGLNLVIMKAAFVAGLHPFAFNAARLFLSALVLALLLRALPREHRVGPLPWGRIFAIGVCGSLVNQCVSVAGVALTTAGNAALLGATSPVWTALLAAVFGIERVRGRTWGAIAITVVGSAVIVLASHGVDLRSTYLLGNALVLAAAFLWALTTTLSTPLVGTVLPTRLALWSTVLMLPFHSVLLVIFAPEDWNLGTAQWGRIAYAGILSTGVAYVLWNRTIKDVGPSLAAVYANLVPVFALAASALLLDEAITSTQLAGGALIVIGVLLARRRRGPGVR